MPDNKSNVSSNGPMYKWYSNYNKSRNNSYGNSSSSSPSYGSNKDPPPYSYIGNKDERKYYEKRYT